MMTNIDDSFHIPVLVALLLVAAVRAELQVVLLPDQNVALVMIARSKFDTSSPPH